MYYNINIRALNFNNFVRLSVTINSYNFQKKKEKEGYYCYRIRLDIAQSRSKDGINNFRNHDYDSP